jgi:hypothetical protein
MIPFITSRTSTWRLLPPRLIVHRIAFLQSNISTRGRCALQYLRDGSPITRQFEG